MVASGSKRGTVKMRGNGGMDLEAEEEKGTDLVEVAEVSGEVGLGTEDGKRAGDDLASKALTEKMVTLMQKISEYGYLSIREIELIYANQTYAYKVLGVLKEKGLVEEFKTGLKPRKAYYLKPKGYRTVAKYGKLRVRRRFLVQGFKPFIFNHRMACARAGLVLEEHPAIRGFLPESLLWERRKNDSDKLCDGEFLWAPPEPEKRARVGLEVELNLKSRGRLAESLRDLSSRRDLDQVWWLCGDETIRRALLGLIMELPWIEPQRHYLGSFEELFKVGHKLEMIDPKGAVYCLDPNKPTLPGRYEPPQEPPKPESRMIPAKAEALQQPEPSPRPPEPVENPVLKWLRDSWEEELDPSDWRRTRKRFARWPHVVALCVPVVVALGLRVVPALIRLLEPESKPQIVKPRPLSWTTRPILDKPYQIGAWKVFGLALASKKKDYRLRVSLGNISRYACALYGFGAYDEQDQSLYTEALPRDLVMSRFKWGAELRFALEPSARQVTFVLEGEPSGCGFRMPIAFR